MIKLLIIIQLIKNLLVHALLQPIDLTAYSLNKNEQTYYKFTFDVLGLFFFYFFVKKKERPTYSRKWYHSH